MDEVKSLQLRSPAKVNVFLEVLGKRDDGFHELETVMLRTDFCDTMHFAACDTQTISLQLSGSTSDDIGSSFPLDDSNLIHRAASALKSFAGIERGAEISIVKRIPAEAGLAGGSSNAATALIGLNKLWDLKLPKSDLHQIAATLGSDVNFFIEECRAAVCRGRGEIVEPFAVRGPLYLVVARPKDGNSTPEIFSKLKPVTKTQSAIAVLNALQHGRMFDLNTSSFNRLTEAARITNPGMSELLQQMASLTNRPAFMSGSGSTCYVLAQSRRDSKRIINQLQCLDNPFLQMLKV